MATNINRDPDLEWLDHVQPVGLVVASSLLKELGLSPLRQTPIDTGEVAELLAPDASKRALSDPWAFAEKILGWEPGTSPERQEVPPFRMSCSSLFLSTPPRSSQHGLSPSSATASSDGNFSFASRLLASIRMRAAPLMAGRPRLTNASSAFCATRVSTPAF